MTLTAHAVNPLAAGTKWKQISFDRAGKKLIRVIEIIAAPTLSSPVGFRVLKNDKHPHRIGQTGSLRRSALQRNYEAVTA